MSRVCSVGAWVLCAPPDSSVVSYTEPLTSEMRMKVVIAGSCYRPTVKDWADELAREFPDIEFVPADTEEAQKAAIRDADVYFGIPPSSVFKEATRLKWVHTSATGINGVAAKSPELIESDVVLTNSKGPNSQPMADHVFAVMLTIAHRMNYLWEDQKTGSWSWSYGGSLMKMSGKTIGIVGMGDVGAAVARRAFGFNIKVYGIDKRVRPFWYPMPEVEAVWTPDRLDDMLRIIDWLVIAAPITPETKGMMDRRRMGLLKHGAGVVVVSRGGIIDEPALYEGLRSGRYCGAGIDVWSVEPPPDIWKMPNGVLSPHASFRTAEAYEGRRRLFKDYLRHFINKEPFPYVCDKRAGF